MVNHSRWFFNIAKWNPTKEEWLKLTSSIASEELERINKFVFQDDAKSSLIGCALIRKFISQAARIPSNQPTLIRNQYGRPEVCENYIITKKNWPKLINFNVSHSGNYCVLAGIWSEEHPCNIKLGVDVTKIVSKKTPDELARFLTLMSRREFTKEEWKTVENAPNDRQKCINFTRLWCLKESFIKAIGLGLSFKLHRISFDFPEQNRYQNLSIDLLKDNLLCDTTVLLDNKLATNWRFLETALDDEHMVAVGYNIETDVETSIRDPDLYGSHFEELSIESIVDSLTPIASADESNWTLFCTRGKK